MHPKKTNFIIRLLVNMTMANLNENDAIDRVKRGSLKFNYVSESISATKKKFIEAQIKKLYKSVGDTHRGGQLAITLRHSYFANFVGDNLLVCIWVKLERFFCVLHLSQYIQQPIWIPNFKKYYVIFVMIFFLNYSKHLLSNKTFLFIFNRSKLRNIGE